MRDFINTVALLESPDFKSTARVYRGTQLSNPDAFADTHLGKPTFTDVYGIALSYAEDGSVFAYDITPRNPMVFDNDEPTFDVAGVIERFGLTPADYETLLHQVDQIRYSPDDDEDGDAIGMPRFVTWHEIKNWPTADQTELLERCFTESHFFIDSVFIQDRAQRAGFDCMIYRGWFTSGEPEFLQPGDSWDGDTALEWRPLVPSIVKLVGEVTPEDFREVA